MLGRKYKSDKDGEVHSSGVLKVTFYQRSDRSKATAMADILKKRIPGSGESGFRCFQARAFLMCSRKGKEPNAAEAKKRSGE